MKSTQRLLFLAILLSSCLGGRSTSLTQWTKREGYVFVETCSRGCYQFMIQPTGRDSIQRFYITNFPDSLQASALDAHNDQRRLHVYFSGKLTGSKQTIQGAGADDRPVPLYQAPSFALVAIRRLR